MRRCHCADGKWFTTCPLVVLGAVSVFDVLLLDVKLGQRNLVHLHRVRLPHEHQVACGVADCSATIQNNKTQQHHAEATSQMVVAWFKNRKSNMVALFVSLNTIIQYTIRFLSTALCGHKEHVVHCTFYYALNQTMYPYESAKQNKPMQRIYCDVKTF